MIVSGPPSTRYRWVPITAAEQLERTAAAHCDNVAIIGADRSLTWRDIREEARMYARALLATGVRRGDHVAVWLPNQLEWLLAWFATAYLGAAVICVNSRYKTEEAKYILARSEARLLLMRESFLGLDYGAMVASMDRRELPRLSTIVALGRPPEGTIPLDGFLGGAEDVPEEEVDRSSAEVEYEQPWTMVFTSGTTGHPKGAVHSHRVLRNECSIAEWLDIGSDSRTLGHMPFFHVAGCFTGVLPALLSGGGVVLMDHWDPRRALELIERERVTVLSGIPTHFIDLINHPDLDRYDTSSLRSGWIGGASNPPEVINGAIEKLGVRRLLPVYGMTETTSVTTFPRPDDPREVVLTGKGRPVSDFELKVIDVETGAELGPGVEGEICVRGHCVMQGYYRDPVATAAVIDQNGWFRTGDLGVLDEDGYLAVTGRRSDMFIVGGSNAYPAEIELALSEHPDIAQTYVVGVPDPRLGEVGYAFVQRRDGAVPDADDIRAFAKARLADFKVPRHIEFVDDWPLTATGKIQRFRLKEIAAEHLNVAE